MLPEESADGIHDPIHFTEGHTVHPLVEILKGGLHGIRVCVIAFSLVIPRGPY